MISYIQKKIKEKPFQLIFLFLIFMVLAYLLSYLITCYKYSSWIPFSDFYENAFTITDAENYLKIAKNGYVTTGNDRNLLVFFPIYPLMIRMLHTITFLDYSVCAFIISVVTSCVSIVLLYKIVLLDYSKDTAFHSGLVYILYPVSTFLVSGLNEGVFLMFLFATVYSVRKRKYILAGIFGFIVALTRLPGLCIGAYMFVETIRYVYRAYRRKRFKVATFLKQCAMMLMTLMGLGTYLLINYILHGDFFKFFEFQKSIWFQEPMNPLRVIFDTIPNGQIARGVYEIGYSNLFACIAIVIAMLYGLYKRVRASYLGYTLVYFTVCYSASWLLSGARYSLGAFMIFISMGVFLSQHRIITKLFYPMYYLLFIYTSYLCTNCIIH